MSIALMSSICPPYFTFLFLNHAAKQTTTPHDTTSSKKKQDSVVRITQ
jgi:hypothetical protein